MSRRDLLLQEMHISQWQLTKPHVLKGDAQIQLADSVKLVVICEENPSERRFFHDVLLALNLQAKESQWFTPEQSHRLMITNAVLIWTIMSEQQRDKILSHFANHTIWHTPNWQTLQQADNKRQFWQLIEPFCATFHEQSV